MPLTARLSLWSLIGPLIWPLLAVLLAPLPAQAEGYVLQPGDRVDIRVAGLPNLDRDLRIGADGTLSLPLIGRVSLGGQTVGAAEQDVARRFGEVASRQRTLEGRETLFPISPSEVSLSVTEFLPVYVSGEVKAPGAFAFTPGLTVRRALTLSGGIGQDLGYVRDPMAQIAQVQGNIDAFGAELAALDVRVRRYQAELDPGTEAATTAISGTETVEELPTLTRLPLRSSKVSMPASARATTVKGSGCVRKPIWSVLKRRAFRSAMQ